MKVKSFYAFNIADIRFKVYSSNLKIMENYEKFNPFLINKEFSDEKINSSITITLRKAEVQFESENLKPIFNNNDIWSMYSDDDAFYIALYSPKEKEFIWHTKSDRNFENVKLYCSPKLYNTVDGEKQLWVPVYYPLSKIILSHILSDEYGILLHAGGLRLQGKGFVFPGVSGAGKTTLIRQFFNFSEVKLLSDDRMAVRRINGDFRAYGTPWAGDAGVALNESAPLGGIFFIAHSGKNSIANISPQEAFERIIPTAVIPWYDESVVIRLLGFIEDILATIPAFELRFRPNQNLAEFFNEFVSKL